MKRTAIAAVWILGTTVPLLVSVFFFFGCCVLPFHGVIHKAMPLCNLAIKFAAGGHQDPHGRQQPLPARARQEPARRTATSIPRSFQPVLTAPALSVVASEATAYRSFISLGATRCDRDVGLHLLLAILLI